MQSVKMWVFRVEEHLSCMASIPSVWLHTHGPLRGIQYCAVGMAEMQKVRLVNERLGQTIICRPLKEGEKHKTSMKLGPGFPEIGLACHHHLSVWSVKNSLLT